MPMPKHEANDERRETVKAAVAAGFSRADCARAIGVSEDTLLKYYKPELERGDAELIAGVAQTLMRKALDGDTTAAIFIMKTRGGWSEKSTVDMTVRHEQALEDLA